MWFGQFEMFILEWMNRPTSGLSSYSLLYIHIQTTCTVGNYCRGLCVSSLKLLREHLPFQVSVVRRVVGDVEPSCVSLLAVNFGKDEKRELWATISLFCQRGETVWGGGLSSRRGGTQASVSFSVRGSSGGSCGTFGTAMPRWSFSKDCFIWQINMDEVMEEEREREARSGMLDYTML